MKNSIDRSRMAALWRIALHQDLRKYALWLIVGLGIILIILIFSVMRTDYSYQANSARNGYATYDPTLSVSRFLFYSGLVIFACLSASCICANLDSRPNRLSALMLPASQLEKFSLRCIIFVPMALVAYLAGFFIVDLMRYLYACIFDHDAMMCVKLLLPDILHHLPSALAVVSLALGLLALQSFYVLGSAIWPRRGFLFTSLFGIVFYIILSMSAFTFMNAISWTPLIASIDFIGDTLGAWVSIAICIAVICVNYWLAYERYKEMEIIDRW